MTQLAIEIDETTQRLLATAAREDGVSLADWIRQAVRLRFDRLRDSRKSSVERLPSSFFEVLGTWEDDRDPDQILREIRESGPIREREPLL